MTFKVLLRKDFKQVAFMWWMTVLVGIGSYTVYVWSRISYYDTELRRFRANPGMYGEDFRLEPNTGVREAFDRIPIGDAYDFTPYFSVIIVLSICAVLLAALLIGAERNSLMSDFMLSLPFSRTQLYISKWVIGASAMLLTTTLGGLSAYVFMTQSAYGFLLDGKVTAFVGTNAVLVAYGLAVFTLALTMGSLGGEATSQVVWTIVYVFLPVVITALVDGTTRVFTESEETYQRLSDVLYDSDLMRFISPVIAISDPNAYSSFLNGDFSVFWDAGYLLLFAAFAFVAGWWMFNKVPQEYNGRFFMYGNVIWVVQLFVVVLGAMFGGIVLSTFMGASSRLLYIVGFVIGGGISFAVTRWLFYRFNLKMRS